MTVWKVAMCRPREIHMALDHTWTERGKRVVCWSGFPLQGVHRFESPRLSDMSNHLFVVVITYIITKLDGLMDFIGFMRLYYN
jgi:hypothetical protein